MWLWGLSLEGGSINRFSWLLSDLGSCFKTSIWNGRVTFDSVLTACQAFVKTLYPIRTWPPVPEASPATCPWYSNGTSVGFPSAQRLNAVWHDTQERSFLALNYENLTLAQWWFWRKILIQRGKCKNKGTPHWNGVGKIRQGRHTTQGQLWEERLIRDPSGRIINYGCQEGIKYSASPVIHRPSNSATEDPSPLSTGAFLQNNCSQPPLSP